MNSVLRKLPIGIQTFEDIRRDNYLYVDKTAFVWRIANTGKPYFLSRPRRFGKACCFLLLKLTLKVRKSCSKDWPSNRWKRMEAISGTASGLEC